MVATSILSNYTRGRYRSNHQPHKSDPSKRGLLMTTLALEFKGGIWVTQGRSHPGLADRSPKPTEPPKKLSLQSRASLEEEEEEESPRASAPCSAGLGPNSKVRGSSQLVPSLHANHGLKLSLEMGECGPNRG